MELDIWPLKNVFGFFDFAVKTSSIPVRLFLKDLKVNAVALPLWLPAYFFSRNYGMMGA
jgi:hypothetical protein